MIVLCATLSKSLNPRNIDKSVSDIRIRLPVESNFWIIGIWLQTHYPAGYPTGKPHSDHLWSVLNMIRFPDRDPTGMCNSEPDPDRTGFRKNSTGSDMDIQTTFAAVIA